jgi:hypothetical protein
MLLHSSILEQTIEHQYICVSDGTGSARVAALAEDRNRPRTGTGRTGPHGNWAAHGDKSAVKIVTLAINPATVVYLVFAKRLFGVRGGGWPTNQPTS